ncbi:acyl-CoA thioester hydrolase [Nocardioides zeae]|uniref:Acyl-CoA thioester hydrolase n=1 Tax=Nocardioides zeae TaxID=1457234 RepID=A0ACC6IJ78_9ACTN|nr:thioesterase family protein [Nocardioides zeae]MDR6174680.1 acyl-CoA thioester hydrolase [Nocardioides zeae]MDR6210749.1 acyl-CoA thioester hydrolase [Nocardioides zeae]
MRPGPPALDAVRLIPAAVSGTVGPAWIDANGHLTLTAHLMAAGDGVERMQDDVGVHEAYRRDRSLGMFVAEQRADFVAELHAGDRYSTHVRVLARSSRAVHCVSYLVDDTRGRVATVAEYLLLHVDLRTRRAVGIPADVRAGLDRWIASSEALGWASDTGRALVLRDREHPPGDVPAR